MSNIKPFTEEFDNDEAEPGHEASYDFDWDGLFRSMGEPVVELEQKDYAAMGVALRAILDWVLKVDMAKPSAATFIGRRVIALAWVLDPERFKGASVRKLAKSLGVTPPVISKPAA